MYTYICMVAYGTPEYPAGTTDGSESGKTSLKEQPVQPTTAQDRPKGSAKWNENDLANWITSNKLQFLSEWYAHNLHVANKVQ